MSQQKLTQAQLRQIQAQLDLNAAKLDYIKTLLQIDEREQKATNVEAWVAAVLSMRADYERMLQERGRNTKHTTAGNWQAPHNQKIIIKKG